MRARLAVLAFAAFASSVALADGISSEQADQILQELRAIHGRLLAGDRRRTRPRGQLVNDAAASAVVENDS